MEKLSKKSCGQQKQNCCQKAQEKYTTHADIVAAYIRCNRPDIKGLKEHLTYYENSGSWTCAVERASKAQGNDGKMHPHQRRIGYATLAKTKPKLLGLENQEFRDFDELHKAVRKAIQKIPQIGVLAIYDTALRLAAFRRILPCRVYLHAGTSMGARNLGLKSKSETLAMSELPPVLRKLSAYEVEDCLCIYKDAFSR